MKWALITEAYTLINLFVLKVPQGPLWCLLRGTNIELSLRNLSCELQSAFQGEETSILLVYRLNLTEWLNGNT